MNILYWFLAGLIFAYLIIQLNRWIDKTTPNDFDSTSWGMIIASIPFPPLGFILCYLGLWLLLCKFLPNNYFKSLFEFLIKERKL